MTVLEKRKIFIILFVITIILILFFSKDILFPPENNITATGTIEATYVDITSHLAGPLKKIYFSENDQVQKKDLIAEQERNDLLAQRERDALTLSKAEISLKDLLSGAQIEEVEAAQANVNTALENIKNAKADYLRFKTLFEQGGCSKKEFETYKAQYEISQNKLQSAESNLSLIKNGTRSAQVDAAQVEVDRSKAVLKVSDAILADLKLHSPITGHVISTNYEEGEYIQAGASIMTIADLENLWIKVYVPTDDLPKIKLGQKIIFTVSGDDQNFEGIVEYIADEGEFTPKTIQTKKERTHVVFQVKIKIDSHDGVLKPGMPADVIF